MRFLFASTLALSLTTSVLAATFTLEHDSQRVNGGEICLFEAGAPDDPLQRLTTFGTVTCSSADESVPLPEGTWNLWARHSSGFISELLLVKDQRVEGDQRTLQLVAARSLDVKADMKDDSDRVAFYIEDWGTVVPLVPGESSVLVPSDELVFPIFIRDRIIAAIGEKISVGDEELPVVEKPKMTEGMRDVGVGVVPDRAAFEALAADERLPGRITLSGSGLETPLESIDDSSLAFAAKPMLALFRMVPTVNDLSAGIEGDGWSDTSVAIATDGPTEALHIAPATSLAVRWSVASDVPDLVMEFGEPRPCESQDQEPKQPYPPGTPTEGRSITLWRCPRLTPDYPLMYARVQGCELVSARTLDEEELFGEATLEGVPPGLFLLRLAQEPLPATYRVVNVDRPSQVADIDLVFDRWFGKITYGGDPIQAAVDLGWGGVSDPETGEYTSIRAVNPPPKVTPPPKPGSYTKTIFVEACTEEIAYGYIPEETPPPNSRLDIDIPLNEVRVIARSKETREPVEGATVYLAALSTHDEGPEPGVQFGGNWGATDAEGRFSINNVPPNRKLQVCASHERYDRQCADRFAMGDDKEHEVTFFLSPVELRAGRVNFQPIKEGQVVWYSQDGLMTESVTVESDGSFSYKKDHAAGELLFVIAANAPLLATHQPALAGDTLLEINYPVAPTRSFEVSLSPSLGESSVLMTIAVGDVVVPINVLSWHASRRRTSMHFVATPAVTQVTDILATGPISIIFATEVWAQTNPPVGGRDLFYSPAALALPRTPTGDSTRIVLGGTGSNLRIAAAER